MACCTEKKATKKVNKMNAKKQLDKKKNKNKKK